MTDAHMILSIMTVNLYITVIAEAMERRDVF